MILNFSSHFEDPNGTQSTPIESTITTTPVGQQSTSTTTPAGQQSTSTTPTGTEADKQFPIVYLPPNFVLPQGTKTIITVTETFDNNYPTDVRNIDLSFISN
jgi:hypothetical protein